MFGWRYKDIRVLLCHAPLHKGPTYRSNKADCIFFLVAIACRWPVATCTARPLLPHASQPLGQPRSHTSHDLPRGRNQAVLPVGSCCRGRLASPVPLLPHAPRAPVLVATRHASGAPRLQLPHTEKSGVKTSPVVELMSRAGKSKSQLLN